MEPATERKLQVIFDVHQYKLSAGEEQLLHDDLEGLAKQVAYFPLADLRVLIQGNPRSNDVSVKLTLLLSGTTLVTNDHDAVLQTAFLRAVDAMIENLRAYKQRLGNVTEIQKAEKGTHQELHSPVVMDAAALDQAVANGDFAAFRTATLPLEEGLRKRIGRWVQRYPQLQARIGKGIEIADIVEDVFLAAFEAYEHHSADVPFGEWLESLIDPTVKALQNHSDEELENVRMARTARTVEQGQA